MTDIIVNSQVKHTKHNQVLTLPAPPPFSPTVIVLNCKNGKEIARLEIVASRKDAILNHVWWVIVRERLVHGRGLGSSTFLSQRSKNFVEGISIEERKWREFAVCKRNLFAQTEDMGR